MQDKWKESKACNDFFFWNKATKKNEKKISSKLMKISSRMIIKKITRNNPKPKQFPDLSMFK